MLVVSTILLFFLFAACILLLLLLFEKFIQKENGGALHKKGKRKKEDISSAQGPCLCGVWEGRLVDSRTSNFWRGWFKEWWCLTYYWKKIGDFFGTTSQSMANTCLAIKMQLLLLAQCGCWNHNDFWST